MEINGPTRIGAAKFKCYSSEHLEKVLNQISDTHQIKGVTMSPESFTSVGKENTIICFYESGKGRGGKIELADFQGENEIEVSMRIQQRIPKSAKLLTVINSPAIFVSGNPRDIFTAIIEKNAAGQLITL